MLLRKDDPWIDDLPIPDIRDWRVVDRSGRQIGFVETLAVDRQNGVFEALYTGANTRFLAETVQVGDREVHVSLSGADDAALGVAPAPDARRNGGSVRFDRICKEHFDRHFNESIEFEDLRPAYQFGRVAAGGADFAGRSFRDSEEDLKARFQSLNTRIDYAEACEAIRFAYELVRSTRSHSNPDSSREQHQVARPSNGGVKQAIDRSGYTSRIDPTSTRDGRNKM